MITWEKTVSNQTPVPAIEFREVSLAFDEQTLLDDISFIVPTGAMRIILGPSSCGKSTIIKLAIGLIKPDRGEIFLNGQEVTGLHEEELFDLRLKTGVVLQTDALFSMSVAENVGYRLTQQEWENDKIETEVHRVLQLVGLDDAEELMPDELSGGMSRRATIARALAGSPGLMFYDSPCAGLDPIISRSLLREIIRQRDVGDVSSIYVTQTLEEVHYLCSHLYEQDADGKDNLRRENNEFCLTNTRILMLTDGKIIFDNEDEMFWTVKDEKIQQFLT